MTDTDTSVLRRVEAVGDKRVLTISRTYDTDLADLWSACTDIDRIPRWFLPVTGDLRPGGRYQIEGHAGGVVETCDPPHHFRVTWAYGDEVSWVDVRLAAVTGGTRFELAHTAAADDERWAQYGPGAVGVGWDLLFHGLARHLASGAVLDPAAAEEWAGSAEGRSFITASSSAWGTASVAGGADPAQAREAAGWTTAFYTGSEPE